MIVPGTKPTLNDRCTSARIRQRLIAQKTEGVMSDGRRESSTRRWAVFCNLGRLDRICIRTRGSRQEHNESMALPDLSRMAAYVGTKGHAGRGATPGVFDVRLFAIVLRRSGSC